MNRLMVFGLTVLGTGAALQVINLAVVRDLGIPVGVASLLGLAIVLAGVVRD